MCSRRIVSFDRKKWMEKTEQASKRVKKKYVSDSIQELTIQCVMPFHVHRSINFALVNNQSIHVKRRMWLKLGIRLDWRVLFQTDPHTIAYLNHWPNHQMSIRRSGERLQQLNLLLFIFMHFRSWMKFDNMKRNKIHRI